jgi:hypothetical protein
LKSSIEVGVGDAIPKVSGVDGEEKWKGRTGVAVQVRDAVDGNVAALGSVERRASEAELPFLQGRGSGEGGEDG